VGGQGKEIAKVKSVFREHFQKWRQGGGGGIPKSTTLERKRGQLKEKKRSGGNDG